MAKLELILKRCPFCSKKAMAEPWHGGGPNRIMISCSSDYCPASPKVVHDKPMIAARQWNNQRLTYHADSVIVTFPPRRPNE